MRAIVKFEREGMEIELHVDSTLEGILAERELRDGRAKIRLFDSDDEGALREIKVKQQAVREAPRLEVREPGGGTAQAAATPPRVEPPPAPCAPRVVEMPDGERLVLPRAGEYDENEGIEKPPSGWDPAGEGPAPEGLSEEQRSANLASVEEALASREGAAEIAAEHQKGLFDPDVAPVVASDGSTPPVVLARASRGLKTQWQKAGGRVW